MPRLEILPKDNNNYLKGEKTMAKNNTNKTSSKSQDAFESASSSGGASSAWVWSEYKAELPQTKKEIDSLKKLHQHIASSASKAGSTKEPGAPNKHGNTASNNFQDNLINLKNNKLFIGGVIAAVLLLSIVYKENNEKYANENQAATTYSQTSTANVPLKSAHSASSTENDSRKLIDNAIKNIEKANNTIKDSELDNAMQSLIQLDGSDINRALAALRKAYQIDPSPDLHSAITLIEKAKK